MATVPIIHFPTPAEFIAPPPVRQGVVHQFFYTGNVSDPIFFDTVHLWRISLKWGVTTTQRANQVRDEASKLLEAGKGVVTLYFPYKITSFRETVKLTVDYKAKTITYPAATFAKVQPDAVIQVGTYALYPLLHDNSFSEERFDFNLLDEDGKPLTEEIQNKVKYLNMPASGLLDDDGNALVAQGDRFVSIVCRMASAVPPAVTNITRNKARVEDVELIESVK